MLAFAPAGASEFRALPPEEGGAVLAASDDFTSELSPADLSIRLRRADGGNLDDLRALYRSATLAWTPAEEARLAAMVARAQARLEALAGWLPEEIGFIKTSEAADGGFPHTRGAAIIWGPALPESEGQLDFIFYHELWHVLSRHNAARRDEMYALIGFEPCASMAWPAALRKGRLTNPDAPRDMHVIPYQDGLYLMPRLMTTGRYDAARPQFGDYLLPQFVVTTRDAQGRCAPAADGAILDSRTAAPFVFAAAGANTSYIIHPEEILADNFAQLMIGRADAPNPEVQARLAEWLGYRAPAAD